MVGTPHPGYGRVSMAACMSDVESLTTGSEPRHHRMGRAGTVALVLLLAAIEDCNPVPAQEWGADTGHKKAEVKEKSRPPLTPRGHRGRIFAVQFSPDG